ncbi:formylglycine-generating enzyme family protein [Tundrisphaera sp. TA3]|uniref:formylglycine-generating enzyme family protein n=1 Tax=Tundrisphaera sp. TA3 TaxID=3435775 RepID=UPI003EBDFF3E
MLLAGWPNATAIAVPEPPVRLIRWAGEGVILPGRGGEDLIRLVAEARWERGQAIDSARFALRVALPDGRIQRSAFPVETPPGRSRIDVLVPAAAVRDRLPSAVRVELAVIDAATGNAVSNVLAAGIGAFPRPRGAAKVDDRGPFGWGRPLSEPPRVLPRPGPDGVRFARIAGDGDVPGFFLATTEATNQQVGRRLPGYDPRAGRSDEFALDGPDQPAIGLTPGKARDYLKALGAADPLHFDYRLPTRAEWLRAARGGNAGPFWWGDQPTHPEGANFLGPEAALEADATADASTKYRANPFGLFHTFGNADEWATLPAGGFARLGGHFRTEPAASPSEVAVVGADALGPDPFVGVRPAFDLPAEVGADLIRKALGTDAALGRVAVAFDPDRAIATLTGPVPDAAARRFAASRLEPLWFLAAVVDRLQTPVVPPGRLARLGPPTAPPRRVGSLGRSAVEVTLPVAWSDPLPVAGSAWWVNVYLPGGGHVAHRLGEPGPGRSNRVAVRVESGRWDGQAGPSRQAALSLGAPASTVDNPRIVSDIVPISR